MPSFVTIENIATSTVALQDTVTTVEVHGRGIGDAPVNGKYYGRRNEAWYELDNIPEAPLDNDLYGRRNSDWEAIKPSVEEAPEDGNQYARQDGDWSTINLEGVGEAPDTGIQYGRQNETWTPISAIGEAPINNLEYVRKNAQWAVSSGGGGIGDAPADGLTYGRNNYNWVPVGDTGGGTGPLSIPVVHPVQTATAGQTVFSVPGDTQNSSSLLVYINGVYQPLHNWSLSGVQLTFSAPLEAGDKVDVTLLAPVTAESVAGVASLNNITGVVNLVQGNNIAIGTNGQNITISSTGGGGVSSLNNLFGSLNINAGKNIAIANNGSNALTITAEWEVVLALPSPSGYQNGDVVLLID